VSRSELQRLSNATLSRTAPGVRVPSYDRTTLSTGVVHLGPGAFHRAHQAVYFDDLNSQDPRWGITGIALRNPATPHALTPQDGLYTLAALDESVSYRVIGAHTDLIAAREAPERALQALSNASVQVITLTVTEKGYCLGADGRLDMDHPDIAADIASPHAPTSAIGWLVEALRQRRDAGADPFHVLSCDNLPGNGTKLRHAVLDLAAALIKTRGGDLMSWIAGEVRFPSTMVDSITPATDDALRNRVDDALGLYDAWPVQREAFSSWVIEDTDIGPIGFPDLGSVGVTLTSNVAGHEQAKLRLLNGAHSTLAYLGLARGHETVASAMTDAELVDVITRMMTDEIAPSLTAPRGLDLNDYAASVRKRFANPAIRHELAQIAWDGSQKLPIRLVATIADNLRADRPIAHLATGVAAWMRFVRCRARDGVTIIDPNAEQLTSLGAACQDSPAHDVALFVARAGVVPPELTSNPTLRSALERGYETVMAHERAAATTNHNASQKLATQEGE